MSAKSGELQLRLHLRPGVPPRTKIRRLRLNATDGQRSAASHSGAQELTFGYSASQAEASEVFRQHGLLIPVRTLQSWEAGSRFPGRLASVSLRKFLQKYPKVAVKRDPTRAFS